LQPAPLQQRLEPEGIYYVIISACNFGRLLRPSIYNQLDPTMATNSSCRQRKGSATLRRLQYASRSAVMIINAGIESHRDDAGRQINELSAAARRAITVSSRALGITPQRIRRLDMMVAMLTRDPHFQITSAHTSTSSPATRQPSTTASSSSANRSLCECRRAKQYLSARKNMSSRTSSEEKKPVTGR